MNPKSASKSGSTSSAANGATGTNAATEMQNRFMTLLTAQLQNQDPLNPMDNSQMTSQMAQLSTLSGISQLNDTMAQLLEAQQASQSMQAVNLIGKNVVAPGNAINLSSGSGQFGVQLSDAASNVQAVITNPAGVVVKTINLGNLHSGMTMATWDGSTDSGATAPDGKYAVTIKTSNNGKEVSAEALAIGKVSSVLTGGAAGAQLNIDNVGGVKFSDVLQIL
jgi:flagellar basal-body rod modification protein FlgD